MYINFPLREVTHGPSMHTFHVGPTYDLTPPPLNCHQSNLTLIKIELYPPLALSRKETSSSQKKKKKRVKLIGLKDGPNFLSHCEVD